jgi:hypothetical protein
MVYFCTSFIFTFVGLILGALVGYYYTGSVTGTINAVFIVTVLSVLEVSLSFDNAIINAVVLKRMTLIWQQRFLTWGMLIAVFGMRFLFPLLMVAVVAGINPFMALYLAIENPVGYARIMLSAQIPVAAYGGSFLLMVAFKYFFDFEKEVHWIHCIEAPLTKLGKIEAIEAAFALIFLLIFSQFLPPDNQMNFMISGICGIVTYIIVYAIVAMLSGSKKATADIGWSSFSLFLYLNVLDSAFSFDGVVGALAITNNLFIIMLGLGIGAFFVRSLTVFLVRKGTISQFRYLEHGTFYAIFSLAVIMFYDMLDHIPEVITGLIGGVIIALSLRSSKKENKRKTL